MGVPGRTARRTSDVIALPAPVTAAPADPAPHHVRAALDLRLRALLRHDPGARSGTDIEDLHQMRVSVRRMRAALKAARCSTPPGPTTCAPNWAGWAERSVPSVTST